MGCSFLATAQTNQQLSLPAQPTPVPTLPRVLTTMARQPHMAQRSPPCPHGSLVSHCSVAWLSRYLWTATQTVALASGFVPGQLPWDSSPVTVTLAPGTSPRPPDVKTSCKTPQEKKMNFQEKGFLHYDRASIFP